jgi:hypothetical protein
MQLVPLEELDADEVRAVVGAAFGAPRSADWWRWKHEDGPWGPSTGVGAVEGSQLLGVRVLLPWRFCVDGRPRPAYRAVDAATTPAAQGRGLFSTLNEELMRRVAAEEPECLGFFSTPNLESRRAYRRLGWEWLPPIAHRYLPVLPARSAGRAVEAEPAALVPPPPTSPAGRVATAWDAPSWRWRVDERCGSTYLAAVDPDGDAHLVYRVGQRRGLRLVVVVHAWGTSRARRSLLGAVARSVRAVAALEPTGPGAAADRAVAGPRWPSLTRGNSLLAVWQPSGTELLDVARWSVTFADLEQVL